MSDSSASGDLVVPPNRDFQTTFYTVFIHLHPRDEAKNYEYEWSKITKYRPLERQPLLTSFVAYPHLRSLGTPLMNMNGLFLLLLFKFILHKLFYSDEIT